MTPEQTTRFRELPHYIAVETDPEKLKNLATELQRLTAMQLVEIRIKSKFPCPTCGIALGEHNAERLRECSRKQREL